MKNAILISIFVSMGFVLKSESNQTNLENINKEEVTATFDGAEGNYYFFTDSNNKALQFEDVVEKVKKSYDLINGDYVGKEFNINYKGEKIVNLKRIDN